jgi:hypothetical protein
MILLQLSHGCTHIIMRRSNSSDFRSSTSKLKIQLFVFTKNLAKQFVLIGKGILKLDDSQKRLSGDESSLTSESELEMCREDLPMRQRPVKSHVLRLGFSSSSELLLLLLVPEAVLLLTFALVAGVVLVVVVVLVGGVNLLSLGAVSDEVGGVSDEVGGVIALEAAPRLSPPLLAKLVQGAELSR